MKKYLVVILFLSTIVSCGQPQKLVIKTDSDSKEIRYWASASKQLPFYTLSEIADIGEGGTAEILLSKADECLYNILIGSKIFKVYTTTGCIDTIYFYNDSLSFAGDNKKYNDFLTEIEKSDTYCRNYSRMRNHDLMEIKSLSDFLSITNSLKIKDDFLLKNRKFSKQFIRQQQLFTEMRYDALFLMKISSLFRTPDLTEEWINELRNKDFLFTNELAVQSEWFNKSLKDHVFSKSFILEEVNPQNIVNSLNLFLYDSYVKTIHGDNLEYALACFFYDDIFQQNYSEDIPPLYDRFISLFPNTSYVEILQPGIKKIKDLHSQQEDSRIIPVNYETEPANFEEMMRPFAGKVVYIDLWATWCSPCLEMFSHLDNLKEKVLGMEDVVFFYISLDQDRNHEKWQKMSGYYKLYGYHYRVNEQTTQIIHSHLGDSNGALMIPRYVIVDKTGKIAFANAAAPSDADKVVEQLKTLY